MRAAMRDSARRALSTFTNGVPYGNAGEAPSPTIAAAPAAAACAANVRPSALVPGTATNTSPGFTLRLSAVTPATAIAPVRAPSVASLCRRSESVIASAAADIRNLQAAPVKPLGAPAFEGQDKSVEGRTLAKISWSGGGRSKRGT